MTWRQALRSRRATFAQKKMAETRLNDGLSYYAWGAMIIDFALGGEMPDFAVEHRSFKDYCCTPPRARKPQ